MSSIHNTTKAICLVLGLSVCGPAWADAPAKPTSELPAAVRRDSRTITNPTAWMAEPGELQVGLGLAQNLRPVGDLAIGLGGIAEFGLSLQRERADCNDCGESFEDRTLALAYFKAGIPEGTGHRSVPGLALLFRKTLPRSTQIFADPAKLLSEQELETPTAFVSAIASKTLGPMALHLGADLLAAQTGARTTNALAKHTIRPAVGVHYVPPAYPLTTLLADIRWIPSTDSEGNWSAVWNGAAGVRYQARDWAAVDLNIRLQESQGAGDALVILGVRGAFDLTEPARRSF